MATMKEIAKKMNVSITTVSRVLNKDASLSVSEDLRKSIIKTAHIMDYKTPRNRIKFRLKSKLNIAIVHWYNLKEEIDDPFYIKIRRGIEQLSVLSNINTTLIYKNEGQFNFDSLEGIDGMICIGKFSRKNISVFESITNNIVFVDSSPNEAVFNSVVIDYNDAVRHLLKTLIDKGYKSIGYIGGVEHLSNTVKVGNKKELVFRDYLYQKGIINTKFIHVGMFNSESGYKLMKEALSQKNRAEVYFCATDTIAIGALKAIHEKGLNVPGDIGLIGFNDNNSSEFTFPTLSTVHIYTEFMGQQALDSLVKKIEGRDIPIKKVMPTKLIIRKSI